jgi:uncharacterized protein YggL (DUF469 family)
MVNWIIENKEWVFGGVGVAIISGLIALFRRSSGSVNQRQTSGDSSTNIQSVRDLKINQHESDADDE